jgi:hypothetical protein
VTTIGVLGRPWRADVTAYGAVVMGDGSPTLDWWIAADDRWHTPADEPTIRQRRVDGTPVVETRLKVPSGDVVHTVAAAADDGGLTIVDVENDSNLPVAVAFSRHDLLTSRPPTDMPVQGIVLPEGSVVLPIGHHATIRVAVAHDGRGAGLLPADLPSARQVARGWLTQLERASRIVVPDVQWVELVTAERAELALTGLDDPADDHVAFLLGAHELTRLGVRPDDWLPTIVESAERLVRRAVRSRAVGWDEDRALVATEAILHSCGEHRGAGDVAALRDDVVGGRGMSPAAPPSGVRRVAWLEDRIARPGRAGECSLLPDGYPSGWLGANIESYRLPAGGGHVVSLALRWHGERPAALWEVDGPAGVLLDARGADPGWSSSDLRGEALWAAPR